MKIFAAAFLLLAAASIRADEVTEGTAPVSAKKYATEEHAGQAERDKLLDDLFTNYKKESYPDNSTVKFGVALLDVSLDQEHHTLLSSVWLRIVWTDRRLVWDKEERGVSVLRVPPSLLWLPDVTLYNSAAQNNRLSCWESNVLIYPNGEVLWVPPCQLVSFCNLTLDKHPYGEQVCTLKFGSWTFDGFTMGLDFYNDEKRFDVSDFSGSPVYDITQNSAVKNEKKYDCCVEPYYDLTWTLGLKKRDPEQSSKCEATVTSTSTQE